MGSEDDEGKHRNLLEDVLCHYRKTLTGDDTFLWTHIPVDGEGGDAKMGIVQYRFNLL